MKSYTKINKSTKTNSKSFLINLRKEYKYSEINLPIKNKDEENFIIFYKDIQDQINCFKELTKKSLSYRNKDLDDYFSIYIKSEINSSLLIEGVNSSRKKVDLVVKSMNENKWQFQKFSNNIDKLISNYYEAISFIIKNNSINTKNIFILYGLLTADVEEEVIEKNNFYRNNSVYVGTDEGMSSSLIANRMDELIDFINNDDLEIDIHSKAIIAHYIFENIHPYYDFNGRMGRLLHLWILIKKNKQSFWELVYLSDAIYAFKNKFNNLFNNVLKAKKQNANIDLTYFVYHFYEILIKHSKAYIKMKKITNEFKNKPSLYIKLFIIDIICDEGAKGKWYDISFFKKRNSDYSDAFYGKIVKEIVKSNSFEIRTTSPKQFRLKNK